MAKYTVIAKHTLDHKVGDIIELTDLQAKNLANKVELLPVEEKPVKKEPKKIKKSAK